MACLGGMGPYDMGDQMAYCTKDLYELGDQTARRTSATWATRRLTARRTSTTWVTRLLEGPLRLGRPNGLLFEGPRLGRPDCSKGSDPGNQTTYYTNDLVDQTAYCLKGLYDLGDSKAYCSKKGSDLGDPLLEGSLRLGRPNDLLLEGPLRIGRLEGLLLEGLSSPTAEILRRIW